MWTHTFVDGLLWCWCFLHGSDSEAGKKSKAYGSCGSRSYSHCSAAGRRWVGTTLYVFVFGRGVVVLLLITEWTGRNSELSVSAGAASLICAETLRQENFGGRIIMVTRDDLLPYDKTRLSKVLPSKLCNTNSNILVMNGSVFIVFCHPSYRWWMWRTTVFFSEGRSSSISTTSRFGSGKKWVPSHLLT